MIPDTMHAMVFEQAGHALQYRSVATPQPAAGQVLIRVHACGVCRTDLHILDGELTEPKLPLIIGHEIAGEVVGLGAGVTRFNVGDRIGMPWLGWTCGHCRYCLRGQENLCDNARFTGYTIDGGYAEYAVADQRYCFALPAGYAYPEAAPLLCAGLIGYRSYRLAGPTAQRIGVYGFGAAAHIITQVAVSQGRQIYAFTRPGDDAGQDFARDLGAVWAGSSTSMPPEELDAALIFAPAGSLVPAALRAVAKGGVVVCGGIHMSEIPAFPYDILWGERAVRSVANLTREDGEELLAAVPAAGVHPTIETFPLKEANGALARLRAGQIQGAAVLVVAE